MNVVARLTAFVAALIVVFAGGWALGTAVGPFGEPTPPSHSEHTR